MKSRLEHKARAHQRIVRAASKLLRARGVPGMSVERAMAGAGLTVGAFYAHFADKDALLDESFFQAAHDFGQAMEEAVDGRVGLAALEAIVDAYLSEDHRDHPREGCVLPAVVGGAAVEERTRANALVAAGVAKLVEGICRLSAGAIAVEQAQPLVIILVGGQILARAAGSSLSSAVLENSRALARDVLAQACANAVVREGSSDA